MAVNSARENGTLIARTDGRIDGANAREFQVALEDAIDPSDRTVILDMEKLSYISSAGLRVILMTAKTLQKQNAKFAICSLSPAIREVFQISGFDRIIPIPSSQEEAMSSFKGS